MTAKKQPEQQGVVILMAMICLTVMATLAMAMASMSSANTAIASNKQNANKALNASLSGIEVMKYWLDELNISTSSEYLSAVNSSLNTSLTQNSITNIIPDFNDSQINISLVTLDEDSSFSAAISSLDANTVQMTITGICGQFSKTMTVDFSIVSGGSSAFDYGVATYGPLQISGQADISDVNLAVTSSVYIGGQFSGDAFSITNNASIAGEVFLADEYATYSIGTNSSVGGESGDDAHNHVITGSEPSGFPEPNPSYFESFATGPIITSETDLDSNTVLNNATIAAGTNPTFSGDMTINGVLFIKTPNVVHFTGRASVNGIIVGDGITGESLPENGLVFSGQVDCQDVSHLEGVEFDDIKQETGTFILAPGFSVDFSGQTTVENAAIAASGITFTGQAGGTINGSIINYSTAPVILAGQTTLLFNRSGAEENPAGFSPLKKLNYEPETYQEIVL